MPDRQRVSSEVLHSGRRTDVILLQLSISLSVIEMLYPGLRFSLKISYPTYLQRSTGDVRFYTNKIYVQCRSIVPVEENYSANLHVISIPYARRDRALKFYKKLAW